MSDCCTKIIVQNEIGIPGATGATGATGAGYLVSKTTLSSAQILALFTTPITLVAAPGAGFALQVLSCTARVNYNSTAYTTNITMSIVNTGANLYQYLVGGILDATVSKIGQGTRYTSGGGQTQIVENTALTVTTLTGNPAAGDSTIDVYLTYRIITL